VHQQKGPFKSIADAMQAAKVIDLHAHRFFARACGHVHMHLVFAGISEFLRIAVTRRRLAHESQCQRGSRLVFDVFVAAFFVAVSALHQLRLETRSSLPLESTTKRCA
jgi:hypothetical protein